MDRPDITAAAARPCLAPGKTCDLPPQDAPQTPTRIEAFAKEEEGTILFFAVIMMIVMFMLGGMGIDIMRFETTRTELQQTADRATLAAASITQRIDSEAMVRDYFDKAGIGDKVRNVVVTGGNLQQGLNFRNVQTTATADTNPIFMRLYERVSVSQMEARAFSEAEQRISNVEIVMVLDVSGSMGGSKLANLKTSATEFVDSVLLNDTENRVSISIVPYNAQVNIPPILKDQFTLTNDNGITNATCVEFPQSVFNTGPISRTTAFAMSAFSDVSSGTTTGNWYETNNGMNSTSAFCRNQSQNLITLPTRDITTLKARINALTAGGNTSVTLGMKWGLTLVDPSMKSAYTNFVAANAIPNQLAGRPYNYNEPDTIKVIILMTDGEHVQHTYVPDAYKTGQSLIWRDADGYYSIRHNSGRPAASGNNRFWVPHLGIWSPTAFGTNPVRQNWEQIWPEVRMRWVAWQLYARALGTDDTSRTSTYNTWVNNFSDPWLNASTMDTTLQQTCTFARNNNVVVYGIAFEAPTNATNQLRNCSSTPGHFFNAQGLEIQSAFRAIANNISQLRLLQ